MEWIYTLFLLQLLAGTALAKPADAQNQLRRLNTTAQLEHDKSRKNPNHTKPFIYIVYVT